MPATSVGVTARERFNPMSPLNYLLSVMRDSQNGPHVRLHAAAKAAPYVHPRLSNVALAPRSLDEVGQESWHCGISIRPLTAVGQIWSIGDVCTMSAFLPKAEVDPRSCDVAQVP
jgi:hypothetical protein